MSLLLDLHHSPSEKSDNNLLMKEADKVSAYKINPSENPLQIAETSDLNLSLH